MVFGGVEIQAATVNVDGGLEGPGVTKGRGGLLAPLDDGVDLVEAGVGREPGRAALGEGCLIGQRL